jgi:hypothetical protein
MEHCMYNKQIIVDYYNGKCPADDPELQRQFLLLKEQAALDWEEMYAGKDSPATVESIIEDYIYNAKLTARTQRTLKKIKIVIVAGIAVAGLIVVLLIKAKTY